jgi:hypothetical protein
MLLLTQGSHPVQPKKGALQFPAGKFMLENSA